MPKPLKREVIIRRFQAVHGTDAFDYSCVKYRGTAFEVKIFCNTHNKYFYKSPENHIKGSGCDACRRDKYKKHDIQNRGYTKKSWSKRKAKSKTAKGFFFYLAKLQKGKECFYKVGITFNDVKYRFNGVPYNCKIIHLFKGSCNDIWELEKIVIKSLKKHSYTPTKKFSGCTECFKNLVSIKKAISKHREMLKTVHEVPYNTTIKKR